MRNGHGNWELPPLPPPTPKEKVLLFLRCPQILIECPVEINSDLEWTSFLSYFFQFRFGSQKLKWTPQILEGCCGRHQCFYLLLTAPLKAIALMPLSLASTYPLIFVDQNTKRQQTWIPVYVVGREQHTAPILSCCKAIVLIVLFEDFCRETSNELWKSEWGAYNWFGGSSLCHSREERIISIEYKQYNTARHCFRFSLGPAPRQSLD